MIQTGFESRVKVQQIIDSQLPEFILDESPKASEFLKQYYISQEYQGGTVDIAENLDQYLKLDNLRPEVVVGFTTLSSGISSTATTIEVSTTKGFPQSYGLLKIDDEIITYTGLTTNTFTGCIRGFSGITNYHRELNYEELVFSTSNEQSHVGLSTVQNLSALFLQEFYKKIKYTLTPGLEDKDFVSDLNVGTFIKEARTLYQTKGTEESFKILFNVLFGETPKIIDLEQFLSKPSSATYSRRAVVVADAISGDPLKLSGQTIFKNNDTTTTASVSEVEIIRRKDKTYYKILLFIGYDDAFPTITGTFNITGSTKNLDYVSVGSSVISVDSTIGFPKSGKIYSEDNVITYTDKSVNQFFGCSGVVAGISTASFIYSDETYYGYEGGDLSKKVVLRITGVLSDYESFSNDSSISVGEQITVKNVGEVIKNPLSNSTRKEIFANSWIYNTSSRYQIDSFSPGTISQVTLKDDIDKSSLKVGDYIDILYRDSQTIVASNLRVTLIDDKQVSTAESFPLFSSFDYDIRRKIKTTASSSVPLQFDSIISDVQNAYNQDDEYLYIASNSLPSYQITKSIFSYNASGVSNQDSETGLYSIITFDNPVSFITGSEIYYKPSNSSITGLSEGVYYVQVLPGNLEIKLYASKSVIGTDNYLSFGSLTTGTHNFTLNSQKERILSPQKILRKFPLSVNIGDGESELTIPGSIGALINGVEILSYKSDDKIYYGPLESVNVLNGGSGYDVINPPLLALSSGNALVQPIVKGSVEKVYVTPQDFDIDVIVSIAITGGNGSGATFKPVIERRRREIEFDARQLTDGGGVDISTETITFLTEHGLIDGQPIVYRPGNNPSLGIGTFSGLNISSGNTLKNESTYYTKYISDTTIQLYQSLSDYRSGINTVGFTTIGTAGIQKFATEPKNTLTQIKVINGGNNYTNRKLRVLPIGISTINDTVSFTNHGFGDGEIISYSNTGSIITGLSTSSQYYILKLDSDTFRLADAGIGGTIRTNYERRKYVSFQSSGSGYHIFNYPDITFKVEYSAVGLGSTQFRGSISATPIVRGAIVDTYVYDDGSDYGSSILNYQKKPSVSVKNGKNAQFKPIIINGRIEDVAIQYGGSEYYSTPDIVVSGVGTGAILKPIVEDNKVTDVLVINAGVGYSTSDTTISVVSAGKKAIFDPQIRSLNVNNTVIYNDVTETTSITNEIIKSSSNNLQYFVCGYSGAIQNEFNDTGENHSPIIGWAYDGNPIYGSYGYSDPEDKNSDIKKLVSSYILDADSVENRPSGFSQGFFIEDYKFTNSGDLDQYNGRFCVTPEFPNGVYAYFATSIVDDGGNIVGSFPYFIGDRYRSKFISDNKVLNQSFDFNNSNLIRNTFPYKVNEKYAGNDFIVESNEVINQITRVESVTSGSIDTFEIINSGNDYKVGDSLQFNESDTDGGGLSAQISEITGKEIVDLQTSTTFYDDAIFTWNSGQEIKVTISPRHNLENLDYVNVSGFSTSLSLLNGFQQIGVTSYTSTLIQQMPAYSAAGIVTDIYISNIPENISIGSSIIIENENLKVLNSLGNNILRVYRETTGSAHTATTPVYFIPDTFTINKSVNYFESKVNDLVYFNPNYSVGVGTTSGVGIAVTYNVGVQTNNTISIPTQSIYLPNHPFKTNQAVTFSKPSGTSAISVANTSGSAAFNLPSSGDTQTVYVIRQSVDYIGIVTQVGLTTSTNGLFFLSNGSNDYQYSLQSNFTQVKGDIQKVSTVVSVSTNHQLQSGDVINLTVRPNLSVGIGTSTSVKIKYNQTYDKLLINTLSLTGSNVSGSGNPSDFSYTKPTRDVTLDTAVGIAWTNGAMSLSATRNTQQTYDYIWDNYDQFDIDGDGVVSYTDGIIIIRYLLAQPNVVSGITFPNTAIRTTNAACIARCGIVSSYFDVDGDGAKTGLGDGILITRFASAPGDISPTSLGYEVAPAVKNYGNALYIQNHGLQTGDKIFLDYTFNIEKEYFVYKIDKNTINICETYIDSISNPPITVNNFSFTTANFAPINPAIQSIKNNNLVFDLSDSSLSGYNFKIFYDQNFSDEFVSTGSTNSFSISGIGTVGVSTNASLTINYSPELPSQLFYALEKSGYISTADKEVQNYSQINFVDSYYNDSYRISGVGSTTFTLSLSRSPEKNSYTQSECDSLEYSTSSISASGGVSKVRTISPGYNFKKLPIFESIDSESGTGAYLVAKSNTIGQVNQVRILNEGFEYSSDKTLRPEASIPKFITVENSNTIDSISVIDGGKNYTSNPDLIIVDSDTGEKIDSGLLIANLSGTSINSVTIDVQPNGLPESIVTIKTINNTNGVGIQTITASASGIVTCLLTTPLSGFGTEPFAIGDKIFVEGIQKYGEDGDGLNSEDYGYAFFTVSNYLNGGTLLARQLEFNLSGLTTNPGIAKTVENSYGTIVNYNNYPKFNVTQKFSNFISGEILEIKTQLGFIETDLRIVESNQNYIKISGTYEIEKNDIIRGTQSGSIATLNNIKESSGKFTVGYASTQRIGWLDDIGKLDEDTQVISNNDYYQNLSYSIKSKQEWVDIISPVNNIIHPIGLKNFADTEIIENSVVGIDSTEYTLSLYDIVDENRVDTINNFDLVLDVNTFGNSSRFLKFKNKKLADYIECRTNRVLEIDDISSEFSTSNQDVDVTSKIVDIDPSRKYNRYLVQISSKDYSKSQFNEIIILNNNSDVFTLEKGTINTGVSSEIAYNSNPIGDVYGYVDDFGNYYLRFDPIDGYATTYNIKYLNTTFIDYATGVGTTSIGFVTLTGITSTVSAGSTAILAQSQTSSLKSIHSEIHLIDNITNEMNYVELFVDHDGTNTNIAEFYFDTFDGLSSNFIGSFGASISGGILTLNYENTTDNSITIRTKNVGFGSTSTGIGTYRFKDLGQIDETENTVKYEALYSNVSSASTIKSFNVSNFTSIKSTIKISIGQTSALHQVMLISDGTNTYTTQYPFVSIGSTSGIGTFGGEISGSTASLKFYPDSSISGTIEVMSFNESFYRENDYINTAPDLEYSNILESVGVSKYYAVNDDDLNKLDFELTYQGTPIFMKTFDPSDTSILNKSTGEFSIQNHFFSTGEELIYRPNSTFVGVAASSVGIGLTLNYVGVVTNILPTTVYAIKDSNDTFRISTRKDYALAGIAVTFTSNGSGNAHELEMVKKNEKSIISVDNIIQSPIAYSLLNYTINNGGQVSAASTIIGLSGISSIVLGDILKIDNEYMKVINVGLGTTYSGPISFAGTFPLVNVQRGFVGSSATTHSNSGIASVYRGSFNISKSNIYFTEAPQGSLEDQLFVDFDNLPEPRSTFNGRVFLKKDYTSNQIYDNISERFTGIGQTYTLTVGGANTVGLGTSGGNGIVLINGIYQTPTTQNNINNNFRIIENTSVGISSIVFSGITSSNGSIVISESDVNLNQLPRGGMIVSLGSTPGVGYAPLVGASVTAIVAGGVITSIGIGTTGNWGSGYRIPVSIAVTESGHSGSAATITATVGLGGTLSFTIVGGGTGYTNPTINISPPSYSNLSVTGVSRLGVGATTSCGTGLLLNIDVGASSTTGIGSTLFEVTGFEIVRSGYGFKPGDVIKPVGLVTAYGLANPLSEFKLTVLDTFTDSFSAWQFGELDYIDSIQNLQDGVRTRFPLYYNSQLLSFERNSSDVDSQLIDFNLLLLIFVNGILQEPGAAYQFNGGTSFTFTDAPKTSDVVSIYFYRGSSSDSTSVNVYESIKSGDDVQVFSNNNYLGITTTQNSRTVTDISASDTLITNLYTLQGIDTQIEKPLSWTKQKVDKVIDGYVVSKARDSIESQIYPTAKIINNITTTDAEVYVDNAQFFNYEGESPGNIDFDALIVSGSADPVSAAITAIVSVAGTIQSLSINNPGSGYVGSAVTVKLSAPPTIGAGIGTIAAASVSIVNGSLSAVTITNPGFGYTTNISPQVITPLPNPTYENISGVTAIGGTSGNITGIGFTSIPNSSFIGDIISGFSTISGLSSPVNSNTIGLGITGSNIPSGTTIVGVGSTYRYFTGTFDPSNPLVFVGIANTSILTVGDNVRALAFDGGVPVSGSTNCGAITNIGINSITVTTFPGWWFLDPSLQPDYLYSETLAPSVSLSKVSTGSTFRKSFYIEPTNYLEFTLSNTNDLLIGQPIYIFDTKVGNGATSEVGVGTTFLDNIYTVSSFSSGTGIVTCRLLSSTSLVGIATTGPTVGKFSWGKLSGFTRSSSPISITISGFSVNSGLTTFPTIQRRGYGLRDIGAIKKNL